MYCVFCAKELEGESRSAAPVKEEGCCCESCYKEFVEPVVKDVPCSESEEQYHLCRFCLEEIEGEVFSASPVDEDSECCKECWESRVLPAIVDFPYRFAVVIPASPTARAFVYELKRKGTTYEGMEIRALVGGIKLQLVYDSRVDFAFVVSEESEVVNERASVFAKQYHVDDDDIKGAALLINSSFNKRGFKYLSRGVASTLADEVNKIKCTGNEIKSVSQTVVPAEPKEKTPEQLRLAAIYELNEKMFRQRFDFIESVSEADAFTNQNEIIKSAVKALFYQNEYRLNAFVMRSFGVELTEEEQVFVDAPFQSEESEAFCRTLTDDIVSTPEKALRALMFYTYALWWDNSSKGVWGEFGEDEYSLSEEVKFLYEFLENLGYEKSEEEVKWYDGTHEVYKPVAGDEHDSISEISG